MNPVVHSGVTLGVHSRCIQGCTLGKSRGALRIESGGALWDKSQGAHWDYTEWCTQGLFWKSSLCCANIYWVELGHHPGSDPGTPDPLDPWKPPHQMLDPPPVSDVSGLGTLHRSFNPVSCRLPNHEGILSGVWKRRRRRNPDRVREGRRERKEARGGGREAAAGGCA